MGSSLKLSFRESVLICRHRALNIGELQDEKVQQPLPGSLMSREADIATFTSLCNKTCDQILRLLAHGLEVRDHFSANIAWTEGN